MLLFGYGVSLDLKHLPVYVYDREGSQQSQDLLKRFQANEYFERGARGEQLPGTGARDRRRPRQDGVSDSVGFFAAAARWPPGSVCRRWLTPPTIIPPTS